MRPEMSARAPSWRVRNLDLFLSVMSKPLEEFNQVDWLFGWLNDCIVG